MSIKVKQGLRDCFSKIQHRTFDEITIRALLILCREYLPKDSLVRELAHFVAHPDRDQGMFHKKINNRYAKWRLARDQVRKIDDDKTLLDSLKTEDDISDLLLGGVNVESVDANLFEIIYFDGLEDMPADHLKKHTGYTKQNALQKLRKYYKKEGKYYVLNRTVIHDELKTTMFKRYNIAQFGAEMIEEINSHLDNAAEAKQYVEAVVRDLDKLQQVIRGTIEFKSVFKQVDLFNEMAAGIKSVIQTFELSTDYLGYVRKNQDEIMLCIMTLLHDAKFYFYDKTTANIFLCLYIDAPLKLSQDDLKKRGTASFAYDKSVIALYLTYEIGKQQMSIPLFVSNLKAKDYLPFEKFSDFYKGVDQELQPIPWFTAERSDIKLILTDNYIT